jgi:hypothetical protein
MWHGKFSGLTTYFLGCYFICCEDGRGKRTFEFGKEDLYGVLKEHTATNQAVYAEVIRPWMLGKYSNQQLADYAVRQNVRPTKKEA